MSFRGSLIAVVAASMVALLTGCGDNKIKAERDSLIQQNKTYQDQLKAKDAEIQTVATERDTLRTQIATAAPAGNGVDGAATPGMDEGLTGGSVKTGAVKTGSARGVAVKAGSGKTSGKAASYDLSADVMFDSGKSTLKPGSKAALDKLVATLKREHAGQALTIEGHTDSTPFKKTSGMTNEKLGLARAKAVLEYLAAHGITRSTMTAVSRADREPKSRTNPALNRRVTIVASSH